MGDTSNVLTLKEGYLAMFAFLGEQARRDGPASELNHYLGSMSCLPDGMTADPVVWSDRVEQSIALGRARRRATDTHEVTEPGSAGEAPEGTRA